MKPKEIRKEQEQNFNSNYTRSITNRNQNLSSQRIAKFNNKMRLCASVIVLLSFILILQTSETKKIKLKDLKKLKKYAFLLAPQSKRFYAIPFPVPLPVFVKRQQIYTKIPVVPRYVHQPYYSLAPAAYADPYADSYAAHSDPTAYQSGLQEQEQEKENSNGSSQATNSGSSSLGKSNSIATAASSGKYLSQLASAIGRAYPVFGVPGSQHNFVGKLLSGQAKVLPPTALLSTLKSPSFVEQQQRQEEYGGSKGAESKGSKQISAPPKFYVNPYALPIRYPALAYHHHHHHPDVMSTGLGYLHADYASPPHYLQAQHIHAQSSPFHRQLAHELSVEPSSSTSQKDTHLQELHAADNQASSVGGDYDVMVHPDERQPNFQQQQQQLVDALRKLRLQQNEEAQIARGNSYALSARQLGLPIIPGQIQLVNYQ